MRIFQMVGADAQGRMAGNFVTEQDYRDTVGRLDMRVYELEQSKAREAALQTLLNERDAELDRLKGSEGVDFNSEFLLPAPSDPKWAVPVRLNFDGAEGEGRLWLSVDPEHDDDEPSIAVEGRENARTLARLLLAWAGDK